MDKDASLDTTERVIEAAKQAANTQTQADIETARILAEARHCEVTDIINARSNASLRESALKLSSTITVLITAAQIYFSYIGKTLIIPDFIWVIILSPWVGVGGAKLIQAAIKIAGKK